MAVGLGRNDATNQQYDWFKNENNRAVRVADAERTLMHSSGCVRLAQQFPWHFCYDDSNASKSCHLIKNLKQRHLFVLQLLYLVRMAQYWRALRALKLDWPKTPKK